MGDPPPDDPGLAASPPEREMAEGSQSCGEEELRGQEGEVFPAVVETRAGDAKSYCAELLISTTGSNSDDGNSNSGSNEENVELILGCTENSQDQNLCKLVKKSEQNRNQSCGEEERCGEEGEVVPAVVETRAGDAKSDCAELIISTTNTNSDDGNSNSGSNEENVELSLRCTEKSQDQKLYNLCKKSEQTRNGFKDPFPLLSPTPLQSLPSLESRLNAQNDSRYNHAVQDGAPPSALDTSPTKSTYSSEDSSSQSSASPPHVAVAPLTPPHGRATAALSARAIPLRVASNGPSSALDTSPTKSTSSFEDSNSESSASPPHVAVAPLTPPRSRATAALSAQTSPLRVASNGDRKSWLDPFPTPDLPARGRFENNTPCSARVDADSDDSPSTPGRILNPDWEAVLSIPKIPIAEETSPTSALRTNSAAAASSPHLGATKVANISVRKVSSLPMVKQLSLEEIFWGALSSGPDGNGLEIDYDEKKERREKEQGREGQDAMLSREFLDRRGAGLDDKPLRRRSFTSPVDTSWEELRSPLIPCPDGNDESMSNESNNNTNGHMEHHSVRARVTINNVTGANLAKEVKKIIFDRKGVAKDGVMTPNRLRFRAWNNIKASTAVANTRELVLSPVRTFRSTGQRAAKLVRTTRQKLEERKELRRQRRLARMMEPPRSWWIVIPADHPYKIAWDVLTMLWAILGAHRTHVRIRDRVFDQSPLIILTEIWFTVDILLNFVTEHKTRKGQVIRDGKAVWARYLTTWFIIDILSLIPWERVWVRPVVEKIKKRNFFQKTFFRSKAVVRVSRVLRGRHIKLFGRVSKQTGTPLRRLVTLVIKYVPKYLVFLRNMKGALVVRALRFVHWLHNMYKKIWVKARNYARHRHSILVGHPILGFIRPSEAESDSESESESESDDDDDESDIDSESVGEYRTDSLLLGDVDCTGTPAMDYRRTASEGSPIMLRRSFSQTELSRKY